jgi:hypothetical protein
MVTNEQLPKMNYQLQPYQPLISRRIKFAPKCLPAVPMVSRRMEFGMRKLKNQPREKTSDQSISSELFSPLPSARSRSQTPAATTASRFSPYPHSPANNRQRSTQSNKSPERRQNGVRFGIEEDEEDDSQDEIEIGEDKDGEGKISKPPGEPGRPRSGGYKLEDILGWNEVTFEAVRVSIGLEKTYPCLSLTGSRPCSYEENAGYGEKLSVPVIR